MSFLDKISNFYYKNRKNILYVLMFLFIFTVFTDLSFAGDPVEVGKEGATQAGKTESNIFFDALNGLNKFIAAALGMLTFMVGLFLNPEWTSGSFIGLVDPLKTMWIMISNIVYFIFAFIFIWIAFMNIIGKEDNYQLKQAIPKFIVGVLIVPFSWFFVQFVISLSGILTVGVLSLPYDTFKTSDFLKDISKIEVSCKDSVISKNGMDCKDTDKKLTLDGLINPKNSESLFGIVAFYTYGVMGIQNGQKLFEKDVKTFNSLADLGVKVIIDIMFVIIYLLLMVALFLALFVRGVMLWVFAMFSPVFGLLYFFGKSSDGVGEGTKNFNIKQFIALAFVPVYVAGALAFGLLFIFIAGHGLTIGKDNNIGKNLSITNDGNTISFGDLGSVTWSGSNSDSAARQAGRLIAGFQGTIGTMVLQVFGLGILWMAVMVALRASEFTKAAVEPIYSFGNSVGELIKKAPTYAPVIPGPGGSMMSVSGISTAGQSVAQKIQEVSKNSGDELGKKVKAALKLGDSEESAISDRARTKKGILNTDLSKKEDFIEIGKHFDYNKARTDGNYRDSIIKYYDDVYGIKLESKDFNDANLRELADKIYRGFGSSAQTITGVNSSQLLAGKLKDTSGNTMLGGKSGGKQSDDNSSGASPLVGGVQTNANTGPNGLRVSTTIIIDNDTQIIKKGDGSFDEPEKNILVGHLINENTIGTMTNEEMKKWLREKIRLDDGNVEIINDAVKEAIRRLKKDGKDLTENDFWKK